MKLDKQFETIESHTFNAELDVVSGFKVFMMGLEAENTLQSLIDAIRDSGDAQTFTYQRLQNLISTNEQPEYMHPYDASIAGYLYALNEVESDYAEKAIATILETPNLWWAKRLAQQIQESHKQNII